MRIVFAGTPEPAVASLDALIEAGQQVVGVLTRTDAKVGRKRVLTPSPVAARAAELGLPVIKADGFNTPDGQAAIDQLKELQPDIGAVVAYGGLLPQHVLDMLPKGWVNLHFSLLPAYRGAAPVQWAIINQETQTGAAVFQLEAGLDTGPVFSTLSRPLAADETAGDVLTDLATTGAELLASTLSDIAAGAAESTPQQGEVTWAPKLASQQAKVDPAQPADVVRGLINGTSPAPGAWGILETGAGQPQRFKIGRARPVNDPPAHDQQPGAFLLEAKRVLLVCQDGVIELTDVQPAGKKMMRATDWARGVDEAVRLQTSITHPDEFQVN
ncbi:methionyl-tRNA formyltransferase [Enteractinococcus coprophilus]|uniref:Methionyl-tRNA formyltransferase n=1 Tax=Enteractinococcus coprophilus TaxID=1027633 RepID=A0A543AJ44_9MICC|nr:methionyl-tRNA formyltransferase [Enteractinococcus coprophilus]TQL72583.1 methionyl-tRNA formyltransferase [Enteractinococcus coprophilus]